MTVGPAKGLLAPTLARVGGGGGSCKRAQTTFSIYGKKQKKQPRFKALARSNLCLSVATAESKSVEPKLV